MKYFAINSVWAFAWVLVSSICVDGGNPKLNSDTPLQIWDAAGEQLVHEAVLP